MQRTEWIHGLPKAELHAHLDGGLRPATILDLIDSLPSAPLADADLATTTGAELADGLPADLPRDPDALGTWFFDAANSGDLPTYLTTFDVTTAVMQTAEAITRVAREAVIDAAEENVIYLELRFAPEQHQRLGLSLQQVIDAAVEGVRQGERDAEMPEGLSITARLIVCAMRHAERSTEIAQLTVDNYGANSPSAGYVVGFDIAGAELGFRPELHAEAFALLRRNLVPFTIHAGEADGVDSIRDALAQGAHRLGHGVRIVEDITVDGDATDDSGLPAPTVDQGPVADFVYNQRIPLEICPTSNTQTGIADTIADHPFGLLHDLDFVCTINTDNRLVSGTTMTEEFEGIADAFDLTAWELVDLTVAALTAAFLPRDEKERLLDEVFRPAIIEHMEALEEETGLVEPFEAGVTITPLSDNPDYFRDGSDGESLEGLTMEQLTERLAELGLDLEDAEEDAAGHAAAEQDAEDER